MSKPTVEELRREEDEEARARAIQFTLYQMKLDEKAQAWKKEVDEVCRRGQVQP